MNLVIFTRCVDKDSSRSAFFHEILKAFAKEVDNLYVLCIEVGDYDLPDNVEVIYLGSNKLTRTVNFLRKNKIRHADAVFCHMNPIYAILSAPIAKMRRKPLVLWYAHGKVNKKLKIAEKLVNKILTSSPDGCNLKTNKKKVIGQLIDTNTFKPKPRR